METVIIFTALLIFAAFAIAIAFASLSTLWNLAGIDNDIKDFKKFSIRASKKVSLSFFRKNLKNFKLAN